MRACATLQEPQNGGDSMKRRDLLKWVSALPGLAWLKREPSSILAASNRRSIQSRAEPAGSLSNASPAGLAFWKCSCGTVVKDARGDVFSTIAMDGRWSEVHSTDWCRKEPLAPHTEGPGTQAEDWLREIRAAEEYRRR